MSRPVQRIWRAFAVQTHRSETSKLSIDPQLIERVRDIVGMYLNPPERALVLCADEKSQIQALDRAQPTLPTRLGQAERRTHDYNVTAPPRCLPLWMRRLAKLSANCIGATARRSSVSFWIASTPKYLGARDRLRRVLPRGRRAERHGPRRVPDVE
jgi:hypothetical protein